jgi:outer membrane protein assembly factor BamD (BamD/ComL family)
MSTIIETLEPIYANLDYDFTYSSYANDIALNLALAYIKDDQTDKAIPILEKLEKDNPDTPIVAKVKEILKAMGDL